MSSAVVTDQPGLLWELFDLLGPVDRAARAQLLEHLVRRPVAPQLLVGEFDRLQVALNSRHHDLRGRLSED
jgi:hypothetical protein